MLPLPLLLVLPLLLPLFYCDLTHCHCHANAVSPPATAKAAPREPPPSKPAEGTPARSTLILSRACCWLQRPPNVNQCRTHCAVPMAGWLGWCSLVTGLLPLVVAARLPVGSLCTSLTHDKLHATNARSPLHLHVTRIHNRSRSCGWLYTAVAQRGNKCDRTCLQ